MMNTVVALVIAFLKATIVAAIFMDVRREHALLVPFAGAGFFWVAVLLWFAFVDVLTRSSFPADAGSAALNPAVATL